MGVYTHVRGVGHNRIESLTEPLMTRFESAGNLAPLILRSIFLGITDFGQWADLLIKDQVEGLVRLLL